MVADESTAATVATTAKASGPTPEEVKAVHAMALGYARKRAPRPDELTEVAQDAATDAVMWALRNFDPRTGTNFESFAMSAVRRFVWRHIAQHETKRGNRPTTLALSGEISPTATLGDTLAASERHSTDDGREVQLPLEVRELPQELRDVVRFFYVDRFDLKEIGLLTGCSTEAARLRLKQAAKLLAAGDTGLAHVKSTGARRLRR